MVHDDNQLMSTRLVSSCRKAVMFFLVRLIPTICFGHPDTTPKANSNWTGHDMCSDPEPSIKALEACKISRCNAYFLLAIMNIHMFMIIVVCHYLRHYSNDHDNTDHKP